MKSLGSRLGILSNGFGAFSNDEKAEAAADIVDEVRRLEKGFNMNETPIACMKMQSLEWRVKELENKLEEQDKKYKEQIKTIISDMEKVHGDKIKTMLDDIRYFRLNTNLE